MCHRWCVYRSRQTQAEARQNQALEQTRDSVLRYGERGGRELLNLFVRRQKRRASR